MQRGRADRDTSINIFQPALGRPLGISVICRAQCERGSGRACLGVGEHANHVVNLSVISKLHHTAYGFAKICNNLF